jgi:hypothetical protein
MPFWNGLWKSVGSIYIQIMQMKKAEVPPYREEQSNIIPSCHIEQRLFNI